MPLLLSWLLFAYGRPAMIFEAYVSPTPGSALSSAAEAVLRSTSPMEAAAEGGVPDLDCWVTAGRAANNAEEARIRSVEVRRLNFMRVSEDELRAGGLLRIR